MIGNVINSGPSINQFAVPPLRQPSVYHSFDGNDHRLKIMQVQAVQMNFLRCLNNLIAQQNRNQSKNKVTVLPYQSTFVYVLFSDDRLLKRTRVNESADSKMLTVTPQSMMMTYAPFNAFIPTMSCEPFVVPRHNPMLQSQDRFTGLRNNIVFKKEDFRMGNNQEDSHEMKPKRKSSDISFSIRKRKKSVKINDTKNITKNFSKAIISYIVQNKDIGVRILDAALFEEFIGMLRGIKNTMTNIKQLRDLWLDVDEVKQKQFNKAFRIFSQFFLKSQSVSYIYNSRIANTGWHLKYRQNLLRALKEPDNFKYIKDI